MRTVVPDLRDLFTTKQSSMFARDPLGGLDALLTLRCALGRSVEG